VQDGLAVGIDGEALALVLEDVREGTQAGLAGRCRI